MIYSINFESEHAYYTFFEKYGIRPINRCKVGSRIIAFYRKSQLDDLKFCHGPNYNEGFFSFEYDLKKA